MRIKQNINSPKFTKLHFFIVWLFDRELRAFIFNEMEAKICNKCEIEKPLNEFGKNKSRKDGHNHLCKICNLEYFREWKKNNPCTPEQQAGADAEMCPKCKRKTIHQILGECIICGYNSN